MTTTEFSNRELATVLAALRQFQQRLAAEGTEAAKSALHFAECEPLTVEEIDRLCERLNAPPVSASDSRLVLPDQLSRDALVEIVSWVQGALYLDEDHGREYWNPAKDWSGWDVCQHIQEMLNRHGLVPREEQTSEGVTSDQAGVPELVSWVQTQGLGPEDLDEAVHEHASGIGTKINNQGLRAQVDAQCECAVLDVTQLC